MTNPNDPAFLNETVSFDGSLQKCGLSKREYFSIMAMQGLVANEKIMEGMALAAGKELDMVSRGIAAMAISKADALISELNKNEKTA